MHGKGQIIWQDKRKYTGVKFIIYKYLNKRNMRMIKNMVEAYLNGMMVENMLVLGFRVPDIKYIYVYKYKNRPLTWDRNILFIKW